MASVGVARRLQTSSVTLVGRRGMFCAARLLVFVLGASTGLALALDSLELLSVRA